MHLSNAKPVGDIGGSSEFTTRSWLSDGITYDIFRILCLLTGNFHSNFLAVILLSHGNCTITIYLLLFTVGSKGCSRLRKEDPNQGLYKILKLV